MLKRFAALGFSTALCFLLSVPAYAGIENHNGALKYLKEDTGVYAVNEWANSNGNWYYFDKDGNSAVGWIRLDRKWYYLDPSTGIMKTGWFQNSDNSWYYLDDITGEMLSKTRTPDGYYVEKNGKYNPDKGNVNDDKKGPGANIIAETLENKLKGVVIPDLTVFATDNLSTDAWGAVGSIEALNALGANIVVELNAQGTEVLGDKVFYIDSTSITYSTEGPEKPAFRLIKNGDHYELYDYVNIDKSLETPLYALCSLLSTDPQKLYNTIYTAAQYDQTIMSFVTYKTFGDFQIMYTVPSNQNYFYFSIKEKA